MVRLTAILSLLVLLGVGFWWARHGKDDPAGMEVKYRYLVVSIEAPHEWVKQHHFFIEWHGETVELPVAFRIPDPTEDYQLGAGPELFKYLVIGKTKIPVTAESDTPFRVSNEGGVAMIPETGTRPGVVAFSLVHWVTVSPPEQPGQIDPLALDKEMLVGNEKLQKKLAKLKATGRVIDLTPDQ